jgi:hypothetical protein
VGSTAIITLAANQLRGMAGEHMVAQCERSSDYGTSFCEKCRVPASDPDSRRTLYCVPVGLPDDNPPLLAGSRILVVSKASWEAIGETAPRLESDGPARSRDQTA